MQRYHHEREHGSDGYLSTRCAYISQLNYGMRQIKFVTGWQPIDGKSLGIGEILSSLAFDTPASINPFWHILANFSGRREAALVVVIKSPSLFTRLAANATSSSMSDLTLHLFLPAPRNLFTLVLGGSRITMSNCSFLLASLASQSKP